MAISAFALFVAGSTINILASSVLTLHVLFLHAKLQEGEEGEDGKVVLNNREPVEQWFIIGAVLLFLLAYALVMAGYIMNRQEKT